MSFWGIKKPSEWNVWNERPTLERYNSASRKRTIYKLDKLASQDQPRPRTIFKLVTNARDSDRNQIEKQRFLDDDKLITDIICVSGHSGVIDTGHPNDPRIPKIEAKCTTIFFSRLGQCSFTSNTITRDGFKALEQSLKNYHDGSAGGIITARSFVPSIVNGQTEHYFGIESPLTINLKGDDNVHDLSVFGKGSIHGKQPVGTENPILASSFIHIKTADIQKSDPTKPLEDIIETYFNRNPTLKFVDDGKILRETTGPTHLTRKGDRVTLDDIYTAISNIPEINLDTTVLLFFGCRSTKTLFDRIESSSERDSDIDGGKRKTKSNKKSVRRKGKNGSRQKGRSRRKWRHTMHRMRRVRK